MTFVQKAAYSACTLSAVSVLALLAAPAGAATFLGPDELKLEATDAASGDRAGYSVGLSGTTGIVGAYRDDDNGSNSGAAYLFDVTTGTQTFKLTASDAASTDFFGQSVAVHGNTAIVGARTDDDHGASSGSAYLFDTTTGTQLSKLTASDAMAGDAFGRDVALSGNTAVVGAQFANGAAADSGAAYLFNSTTGAQTLKLMASDGAANDNFGFSVAMSGTTAIVGAYGNDAGGTGSGAAYLFDTNTGAQLAKLTPGDGAGNDRFGYAVAISGTTALVGAYLDDDNGTNSGSVYVFDTTTGTQIGKLTADDGQGYDYFGVSVAIEGNTALIGAHGDDDTGNLGGAAYVFDLTTGNQVAKLTVDDGAANDRFGYDVAMSGGRAIGGAFDSGGTGAAYVFTDGSVSMAPVPLPAGLWLLGSAMGLLVLRGRRRA